MCDGRTGRKARHRPDRTAHAQRTKRRPGKTYSLFQPSFDRLPAGRRASVWMGQAQRQAGPGSRRTLAGGHGHGRGDARQPASAVQGQSPIGSRWYRDRQNGDDRHRHRDLHHPGADRRRDARPADGTRSGRTRRYQLSGSVGFGWSFGAASSGSALFEACTALREKVARRPRMDPATARFVDGSIASGEQSRNLTDLVGAGMDADGEIQPGRNNKDFSQQSYGAHFAEVGVDVDTGEVRLRRMLGVFTAGRVLNAKTARSQAIGGMVFGVGAALHEEMALDARFGFFVNHDLAEYHVPVHADIPAIDAIFLAELDDRSNPLKSKGIGELGICGAGASIANAVYNACGVQIRDYPITLDKLLSGLPARA